MLLNKTLQRILSEIISEKGSRVYGRKIAKKYKLNQKTAANILLRLEKSGILKYKKEGKNKYYFLNEFNPLIKDVVQIIEIEKRADFLKEHKSLVNLFREIEKKSIGIVILFGSYAKGTETYESDIDLFVLGDANLDSIKKSYGEKINIVKSSLKKFDRENPLVKEIMKNHIILKGVEEYINLIW